jgi:hypothetical protein
MSALSGAASGNKHLIASAIDFWNRNIILRFRTFIRDYGDRVLYKAPNELVEYLEYTARAHTHPNFRSNIDIASCWRQALDRELGNPLRMYKDPLKLKHYAIQYWNPTSHKINIHSLGLPDPEGGRVIDFVAPGEVINIPETYTTGGKYSTLTGVAPQLKPLPKTEHKDKLLLDLSPASYVEWLTYSNIGVSPCCSKPWVWADAKTILVCGLCKK